ncbi:MAG: RagB/SusD family nutrient uptake outer membrane protein [Marinifilaceae bacterium]
MKLKYLFSILLIVSSLTQSCDDFLNVNPEGEVTNDDLFKTYVGFEESLYGVYAYLATPSLYGQNLTHKVNDVVGQYFIGRWDKDPTFKLAVYNYMHQDTRVIFDNIWNEMYKNISHVNNILINLETKQPDEMRLYNIYKAEALGLRAFMHFELLRLFCDNYSTNPDATGIPYYTTYSFEIAPFEKASITYKKIIEDLVAAETLLTDNGEYFDKADPQAGAFILNREIHMNLYAIQAILARVYWTMNDMVKAKDYALKVIESGVFQLEEKTGIEDLMNGVISEKETVWGLYSERWPETTRVDMYATSSTSLDTKGEHEDMYAIDLDGVDYRWEGWFKTNSEWESTGLRCMKTADRYKIRQQKRPVPKLSGLNMIRLPEMYYIVSEYYVIENDQDMARKYFDKVLRSRGLKGFADRSDLIVRLNNINAERRKEFIGEGLYFHVMKRYMMDAYDTRTDQLFRASSAIYNFPIPEDEYAYRQ